MAETVGRGDTITDVYGNTRTISKNASGSEIRNIVNNIEREKALLEAAKTGDYSNIAGYSNSNYRERAEIERSGDRVLKKVTQLQGVNTGDYSGASADAPMLLAGSGYDKVFKEGKGYAVYDSFTDEDGTQYLAVAGKNSSFIQKINADGTTERMPNVSRVRGKRTDGKEAFGAAGGTMSGSRSRGKNVRAVLDAFGDFKNTLTTDTSTDTSTDTDDETDEGTDTTTNTTTNTGTTTGGGVDGTVELDPTFSGSGFTPVNTTTDVLNVGAGEVAPINPNVSQTVNQAVGGVNYQPITPGNFTVTQATGTPGSITSPTTGYVGGNVSPQANVTGTFTQPVSTAGMSAVPGSIMYKTQYAGTQGAVPQGTVATAPGTGQSIQSGYEQHPYINKQTTQEIMVTEFNGQPVTYVPPGFVRKFPRSSASTQATSVDKSITGVAAGGDIDRDTILAKRFLGFEGSPSELEGFLASNPGASSRMSMYRSAMGRQNPNVVPNEANIAGQPHRLAYVNPQEEKLLEAAGGAGEPSYGGIPAYFSLAQEPL